MVSLIQTSNLADMVAYHLNAAKLLAPFAASASAQHLKNARALYAELGRALGETQQKDAA